MKKKVKLLGAFAAGVLAASAGIHSCQYRDTTIYAESYSKAAFASIEIGMPASKVKELLGKPLEVRHAKTPEKWLYEEKPTMKKTGLFSREYVYDLTSESHFVEFDARRRVSGVSEDFVGRVRIGMSPEEVESAIGPPLTRIPASIMAFHYSKPGGNGLFQGRVVKFNEQNQVVDAVTYSFYD